MSYNRKQNREAAQKLFDDACRGAGLSSLEKRGFSKYMHNKNLLKDYMDYNRLKRLAREWQRSHENQYKTHK
ncbi:MAG: hypothetical protein U9Q70_05230 [Chloroflexota bacterium]|nr:hypothetical protein [Chloroflexota bacterium]